MLWPCSKLALVWSTEIDLSSSFSWWFTGFPTRVIKWYVCQGRFGEFLYKRSEAANIEELLRAQIGVNMIASKTEKNNWNSYKEMSKQNDFPEMIALLIWLEKDECLNTTLVYSHSHQRTFWTDTLTSTYICMIQSLDELYRWCNYDVGSSELVLSHLLTEHTHTHTHTHT